jgi:MFS family permease
MRHAVMVFFGWKVVATASVVATCSFGFGYFGPAVFLSVLHALHEWPVSLISAAISLHFLVSALLVPHLPDAHERLGVAPVTLAGIIALQLGVLGWSLAAAPWQLFVASLLSGAGWAAAGSAAIITMVSPWFDRRRALALGLALNGASIGGIVFAPLWVLVIAAAGFADAVAILGAVTLAALVPLIWRHLTPTPQSLQLAPDGAVGSAPPHRDAFGHVAPMRPASFVRSRPFITLAAASALGMFAQVGITAHIVMRLVPLIDTQYAAGSISLTTACAMIGRILLGLLLGRADRRLVAALNFVMQACGVSLLALGSTPLTLVLGCVLFGLGIGSLLLMPPLIAQSDFPPADVPRVVALVTAVNQAVFAFAPAFLGILREFAGDYVLPFLIAAGLQLLAGLIAMLGRVPMPRLR